MGPFLAAATKQNKGRCIELCLIDGTLATLPVTTYILLMTMSMEIDPDDGTMCCAFCGKAKVDNIKLMRCTACYLVRYCSVICQKSHRSQHKRACKKRASEIRDELLFRQPESTHLGDCPICMLPLSLDPNSMTSCCSKVICKGCDLANEIQKMEETQSQILCPFCRHPVPPTDEGIDLNTLKRI